MKYEELILKQFRHKEELTQEELEFIHKRSARQKLIEWLYVEHKNMNRKEDDPELVQFHVSLGDNAEDYSIFDTVKSLIEIDYSKAERKWPD